MIDLSMAARRVLFRWLCAAFSLVFSVAAPAAGPIPFAQAPLAVQKGIQTQLGNGTLGEIERDEEDGEVTYTVEITRSGQGRDYTFSEAGVLVGMEVFLEETPAPVQKTIQAIVGQGTIESIDKALDESEVRYDVDWNTKEGATRSGSVLESGKLESVQVNIEETPPAVQTALGAEVGKGQLKEVFKSFDDKAVYYDVTVNRDGRDREFTVAESGKLDSRQVFLLELPPVVQSSIQRTIGMGKLLRIDQAFEMKKGGFLYEVEGLVNGKPYDFSIGPKGAFLGVD